MRLYHKYKQGVPEIPRLIGDDVFSRRRQTVDSKKRAFSAWTRWSSDAPKGRTRDQRDQMQSRSGLAATGVLVSLLADGGGLRAGPGRRTGPQEEPRHSDVTGVGAVRSCAVRDARRRLRGNDVRPRANITGVRVVRGNLSASVPAKR